jgi:hypothetical protein
MQSDSLDPQSTNCAKQRVKDWGKNLDGWQSGVWSAGGRATGQWASRLGFGGSQNRMGKIVFDSDLGIWGFGHPDSRIRHFPFFFLIQPGQNRVGIGLTRFRPEPDCIKPISDFSVSCSCRVRGSCQKLPTLVPCGLRL